MGYIGGVAGRNDDITLAEHIVAAGGFAPCGTGGAQNTAAQAFLDAALVENLLHNDTGFLVPPVAFVAAVSAEIAASCT